MYLRWFETLVASEPLARRLGHTQCMLQCLLALDQLVAEPADAYGRDGTPADELPLERLAHQIVHVEVLCREDLFVVGTHNEYRRLDISRVGEFRVEGPASRRAETGLDDDDARAQLAHEFEAVLRLGGHFRGQSYTGQPARSPTAGVGIAAQQQDGVAVIDERVIERVFGLR